MTTKTSTRSKIYVETLVDMHKNIPSGTHVYGANVEEMEALLQRGIELTDIDEARSLELRARHDLKSGECFFNAQLMAFIYENLTYVEGIASSVIPAEHAWLIDSAGLVIDPTWVRKDRIISSRQIDYLGIAVPTTNLKRIWKKNKERAVPVLSDFIGIARRR